MVNANQGSKRYQFFSFLLDPTGIRTTELPYPDRALGQRGDDINKSHVAVTIRCIQCLCVLNVFVRKTNDHKLFKTTQIAHPLSQDYGRGAPQQTRSVEKLR